jgi:hypothetical protein
MTVHSCPCIRLLILEFFLYVGSRHYSKRHRKLKTPIAPLVRYNTTLPSQISTRGKTSTGLLSVWVLIIRTKDTQTIPKIEAQQQRLAALECQTNRCTLSAVAMLSRVCTTPIALNPHQCPYCWVLTFLVNVQGPRPSILTHTG